MQLKSKTVLLALLLLLQLIERCKDFPGPLVYWQGFVGVSGSIGNHRQTKGTMGTIGTRSILHLFLGFLQQRHYFYFFDDNF